MKAGAEIHFLAGQLFTLGVAALAVGPRMPFDDPHALRSIGGNLSFPFRRALLGLVLLGTIRVVVCHIVFPNLLILDATLGTLHVVGQTFLCLTTAYLLQVRLSQVINIVPGSSLTPIFLAVTILTPLGVILSHSMHPNWYCLSHLSEAISCIGVLQTLRLYSSVTAPNCNAPFLTQLVRIAEYCFLTTSLLSFIGQASRGFLLSKFHGDDEDHPLVVFLAAVEHNQDSGIDDWTRLLIHSIFLNSLDEMQHFTTSSSSTNTSEDSGNGSGRRGGGDSATRTTERDEDTMMTPFLESHEQQLTLLGSSGTSPSSTDKQPLRSRHPQQTA